MGVSHVGQPTLSNVDGVHDILVVGIVRNCAGSIGVEVKRLREALAGVQRTQWFLVESDSSDASVATLDAMTRSIANFRFVSLGKLAPHIPQRTVRIAHCRNRFLEEIRSNPLYANVQFVVIADLDNLNTLISAEGFQSCWERDDWDVCTANQAGRYYDIWALRHDLWSPNDCWRQYEFLLRYNDNPNVALDASLYSRMIHIPVDSDWIEVDSAFGGFAVYRRRALDFGMYEGMHADGREQVEHVPLHRAMKDAGMRIFINPRLINADGTEHTMQLSLRHRLSRKWRYWKTRALNRLPGRRPTPWFDPFSGAR